MSRRRILAAGFTLLEVVMVVVILSVVGAGMLTLINNTAGKSADPLFIQQANSIARSYLEEALLRPFCDPDFDPDANPATLCPADCTTNACGTCTVGEASRDLFDDVCDYDGLADTAGAIDQTATAIPGLEAFNVTVEVVDDAGANLNGLTGAGGQVVLVNVSVTHDDNQSVNVTLSGYRTNF